MGLSGMLNRLSSTVELFENDFIYVLLFRVCLWRGGSELFREGGLYLWVEVSSDVLRFTFSVGLLKV
jgi:hypothetical protein